MSFRWILFSVLVVVISGPAWGQTIASAAMTLIDHDGNGFANIGDEVEVSVVANGTVPGTSVRIFNVDLFESAGPFSLYKISPGFGDGIEYARTLTIGPGSHNGVEASSVDFIVQARLDGSTTDDLVNLNLGGVTELIDNSPPTATNAVFTGAAATLITGTAFEVGIDASDGGNPVQVLADLSRLGLGDAVAIPNQSGETWLLDGEQILEAATSEQVSQSQDRSIVFTVTDAAGHVVNYDSAADNQVRMVDNVSPPPPQLKAFQRASNFSSTEDLFDLVVTDGPDPMDQFGEPLLNDSGQPITYSALMAGGTIDVYYSVSGQPSDLLTTLGYNSNGSLVMLNLPFTEFAEGKSLDFEVRPVKSSGLSGDGDNDSLIIQRGVVEAIILEPEGSIVVGNGPELSLSSVVAQLVESLAAYAAPTFRAYVRDVANPGVIEFIDMVAQPDGTYTQSFFPDADDFIGAGFGTDVDLVIRPVLTVNGVALRVLPPSVVFQNNPTIRLEIDPDLQSDAVFQDRFETKQ